MSMSDIKKVIITGASGFLGSNLVEEMKKKEEYFVYALSSHVEETGELSIKQNTQYHYKDVIFSHEGEEILKNAIIINCAFPRNSTGTGMADGLRYLQRLFVRSKECGVKSFINISSQSVYSQTREEIATEEIQVCPESPYAVGKYAAELMLESVFKGTGIVYTNLRMASLIGPGFDQRIVNRLVRQALAGETICFIESEQQLGFLDVKDAVSAISALLGTDVSKWRPIYNIGNRQGYSVTKIVNFIQRVFRESGLPVTALVSGKKECTGTTAVSYQLFNKDTGFEPQIELLDSIRMIMEFFRQNDLHGG